MAKGSEVLTSAPGLYGGGVQRVPWAGPQGCQLKFQPPVWATSLQASPPAFSSLVPRAQTPTTGSSGRTPPLPQSEGPQGGSELGSGPPPRHGAAQRLPAVGGQMLRERREEIGGGASGQDLRGAGRFNLLIAGSVFLWLLLRVCLEGTAAEGIGRAPPPTPLFVSKNPSKAIK